MLEASAGLVVPLASVCVGSVPWPYFSCAWCVMSGAPAVSVGPVVVSFQPYMLCRVAIYFEEGGVFPHEIPM